MFVASLLQGLGLGKGVPGKNKLLQFLAPADLAVAAALILAVALVVFSARKAEASNGASAAPPTSGAQNLAALVAGVVAVLAIVRAITDLTVAHQTGAYKFGGFVDGLAAALVAAAAARWGLKANQK
jgi:heme/copper-type cytochrome/quinol oxidase subunit 2